MKTARDSRSFQAMAFYHEKGLVPAFKQAMMFAGDKGRLATLPDIVNAKLKTEVGSTPWETYFTTLSAEYVGVGQDGKVKIIVAHGIGPMANLDGILKAYSFEFKDKSRSNDGGRISRDEFFKLENGEYGQVDIIDMEDVVRRYKYPFLEVLDFKTAAKDPLLKARLGENYRDYLLRHRDFANTWLDQQKITINFNPFIIKNEDANNCSYIYTPHSQITSDGIKLLPMADYETDTKATDHWALAHLLSTGGLMNLHHEKSRDGSLVCDFSCHEWGNGVRFVAIRDHNAIADIHPGIDVCVALRKHWQRLLQPLDGPLPPKGMRAMVKIGDAWFTQYPKKGESMDSYEPEFFIESYKDIGQPIKFRTKIGGYKMFVRYGIKEIVRIAPPNANTYRKVADSEIVYVDGNPKFHEITVQFANSKIDFSKQLIKAETIMNDFHLMMSLL